MLAYEDAGRAAEWITKVFGFRETERFHNGAGTVTDVVLDLDGTVYDGSLKAQLLRLSKQMAEGRA